MRLFPPATKQSSIHRPQVALAACLVGLVAVAAMGGCGGPRSKMPSLINRPLVGGPRSPEQVGQTILRACQRRGWQLASTGPMSGIATYEKGRLMASLNVSWTDRDYNLTYRASKGFDFNPQRNAIHPRFAHWFRGLRRTIDRELRASGSRR